MVRVVCFGGGSAMPKLVLSQLKDVEGVELVSVTSMVDNGGSTGALRIELDVLPPGDIRRHVLALSEAEDWKKKLWQMRFANDIVFDGGHRGHNFANVFIAGLEHVLGSFEKAMEIVHEFMKVRGRCLPATLDRVQLCAELENGQIIVGEDEIDVPKQHDGNLRITRLWLEPEAKAYKPVLNEINKADFIIVGPGDLYSSLVCCFLPDGIREAISRSKAKKIFIAPAMTKFGESNGFSVEDFVEVIENYMGSELDFVLYNTRMPDDKRVREFKLEEPLLLEVVKRKSKDDEGGKFVGRDLLLDEGPVVYDPKKVRKALLEIMQFE